MLDPLVVTTLSKPKQDIHFRQSESTLKTECNSGSLRNMNSTPSIASIISDIIRARIVG